MSIETRLDKIEATLAELPGDDTEELERFFLTLTRPEIIGLLTEWIASDEAANDPAWLEFIQDWRQFLELKGQPTWASWDDEHRRFYHNPNSQAWHDLHKRHFRWGGWTGVGLPPELCRD